MKSLIADWAFRLVKKKSSLAIREMSNKSFQKRKHVDKLNVQQRYWWTICYVI